jgi:hypothetical protein
MLAGYSLLQLAIFAIVLGAVVAIVAVALRAMGITIPGWVVQIGWVLVIALVAIFALILLGRLAGVS